MSADSSARDPDDRAQARALQWILRLRYPTLIALMVWASLLKAHARVGRGEDDWHYFIWGARLLFGDHPHWAEKSGGLHLYGSYHVQIGPLTLGLVALLRRLWGNDGSHVAAIVAMCAMGPLFVWMLERASPATDRIWRAATVLIGGGVVVWAWAELAVYYAHLDDALTFAFACGALWAFASRKPTLTGVLIGLAVASKAWGIVLLPLALAFDGRASRRCAVAAAVTIGVWWLPFVIADTGTLRAGNVGVGVSFRSVLHLFGATALSTPTWIRPLQLVLALVLGAIAARNGRWSALLLLGVAVRVLLDPATFPYYSSGLILAALGWELGRHRPMPVVTPALFALLLLVPEHLTTDRSVAVARLLACLLAIGAAFTDEQDRTWSPRSVTGSAS